MLLIGRHHEGKLQEPSTEEPSCRPAPFGSSVLRVLEFDLAPAPTPSPPAASSSAAVRVAFGAVGPHCHVGFDQNADSLVPGGDLLVRGHTRDVLLFTIGRLQLVVLVELIG